MREIHARELLSNRLPPWTSSRPSRKRIALPVRCVSKDCVPAVLAVVTLNDAEAFRGQRVKTSAYIGRAGRTQHQEQHPGGEAEKLPHGLPVRVARRR